MTTSNQCIMCSSSAVRTARVCLEEPENCKGSWKFCLDNEIPLCDFHTKNIAPYLILESEKFSYGV